MRAAFLAVHGRAAGRRCWCRRRCSRSSTSTTFRARFEGYPVRVEMLSRFQTAGAATRGAARRSRPGTVDIVVGTHRLLQADVEFKHLGLLVIDEEHRFGVTHKERIKRPARRWSTC